MASTLYGADSGLPHTSMHTFFFSTIRQSTLFSFQLLYALTVISPFVSPAWSFRAYISFGERGMVQHLIVVGYPPPPPD